MKERLLALSGVVFTVVFAIAVVTEGNTPDEKSSGPKVVDYYNSHQGKTLIGVFGGAALSALLVLFFSHLRNLARDRDAGAGPTVMVAGAVLWAAGLLLGSTLGLALVSSSDHHQADVAQTLNVLNAADWIPFIGGIAVTLIGAGMTVLATSLVPRWLGWVAIVVGIISLAGPGGFLGFFVAPIWVLVVGVLLLREPAATPATLSSARTGSAPL